MLKDLRCRAARDSEVFQFKENLLQRVKYKRSHLHRSQLFLRVMVYTRKAKNRQINFTHIIIMHLHDYFDRIWLVMVMF